MITKLTKEQERRLPEIAQEWIRRGLDTTQIETRKAHGLARAWDAQFFPKAKRPIIHLSSPLGCWFAVLFFKQVRSQVRSQVWSQVRSQVESQVRSQVESQVESQVRSQVGSQVWSQVGSQVWSQVESQVGSQVESQVESQVRSQVESQVRSQVESQVGPQVGSQVWSQVRSQVWSQVESQVGSQVGSQVQIIWPYFSGHWWAQYFAWVRAMEFIGVSGIPPSYGVLESCAELSLFYPIEHALVVGSRPSSIQRNASGQLHKDEAPALEYLDGWQLFYLNGIAMEAEQVLTPAEKLLPDLVLKEKNADRRRELIRKVGVERMLSKLPHSSLNKSGDYELLSVDLPGIASDVRYLKMLNPSIGCWHLEAINKNECSEKTVEAALNWRNGGRFTHAEILT